MLRKDGQRHEDSKPQSLTKLAVQVSSLEILCALVPWWQSVNRDC